MEESESEWVAEEGAGESSGEGGCSVEEYDPEPSVQQLAEFRKAPGKGPKPYYCEECDQHFCNSSKLSRHRRTHTNHSAERPFVCPFPGCGKSYVRNCHLKRHMNVHSGTREFACEVPGCAKSFYLAHHLKRHMKYHESEKPFKCPVEGCGESFRKAVGLKAHSFVHTGELPFKCDQCDKKFKTKNGLNGHVKEYHLEPEYHCAQPECTAVFSTQKDLKVHCIEVHALLNECPHGHCNCVFETLEELNAHIAESHPKPEFYLCPHPGCGKKFKQRCNMHSHLKDVHFPENLYICSHSGCSMSFPRKYELKQHIKRHEQDKELSVTKTRKKPGPKELPLKFKLTGFRKPSFSNSEEIMVD